LKADRRRAMGKSHAHSRMGGENNNKL